MKVYIVKGKSMYPTLKEGEKLLISPLDRKVRVGDVVIYRLKDNLIVHRVIFKWNFVVKTMGDNNRFADPNVSLFRIDGYLPEYFSLKYALFNIVRLIFFKIFKIFRVKKK